MTFRTRTLLGVFVASSIALAIALALVSANLRRAMEDEIRQSLLRQAVLAGELLSDRPNLADPEGEAARIGRLLDERVTFIAADGRVIGDSEVPADRLATLENHSTRPEVVQARTTGSGSARRRSATTGIDTEYAAAAVRGSSVDVVRVALELTAIENQLSAVRQQGFDWPVGRARRRGAAHMGDLAAAGPPARSDRGRRAQLSRRRLLAAAAGFRQRRNWDAGRRPRRDGERTRCPAHATGAGSGAHRRHPARHGRGRGAGRRRRPARADQPRGSRHAPSARRGGRSALSGGGAPAGHRRPTGARRLRAAGPQPAC